MPTSNRFLLTALAILTAPFWAVAQTPPANVTRVTAGTQVIDVLHQGPPSPPTVPDYTWLASVTSSQFTLTWDPATAADGHRIIRYDIYLNGVKIAETTSLQCAVNYDPSDPILRNYSVCAIDDTGQSSTPSDPIAAPRLGDITSCTFQPKRFSAGGQKLGVGNPINNKSYRSVTYNHDRLTEAFDAFDGHFLWSTHDTLTISRQLNKQTQFVVDSVDGSITDRYGNTAPWVLIESYPTRAINPIGSLSVLLPDRGLASIWTGLLSSFSTDGTHAHLVGDTRTDPGYGVFTIYHYASTYDLLYADEYTDADLLKDTLAMYSQNKAAANALDWGYNWGDPPPNDAERTQGSANTMDATLYLSGSYYRFVASDRQPAHLRWAEVFSDNSGITILNVREATLAPGGGTDTYLLDAPATPGGIDIVGLGSEISLDRDSVPSAPDDSQLYLADGLWLGQAAYMEVPFDDRGLVTAASVKIAGDTKNVLLVAVDPWIVYFEGVDAAVECGTVLAAGADVLAIHNSGQAILVYGMAPGQLQIDVQYTYVGGGSATLSKTVTVLPKPSLAVDANRDGQIKLASEDSSDATSPAQPFRFWLNDDIDRKGVDSAEPDVEDDDDPSGHSSDRDWMLDQIPCKRDLEDFARLWVYTQGMNTAFQSGNMKLGLKWTNITSGAPAIKLYRAADTDGGTGYLFDPTVAQTQFDPAGAGKAIAMTPEGGGAATTVIEGASGYIFPTEVFANLTDTQPKTYLLFEGCKKGAGQLQLIIYDKNGTKIGEGPGIYLDLRNIKEMYERWTVGDGPNPLIVGQKGGGDPAATATISTDRLPSDVVAFQYGPQQTPDDKNYVLFVHGWNTPPWLKDAWAETAFKRLYWQGYKGRFGTFQWPTTYHDWSIMSVFDYDLGEYTAWRSAQPLADLLKNLYANRSYTVSVLAHSMGNVVTGEALQTAGRLGYQNFVSTYVATQAAVPGHCFDGGLTGGDLLSFGFLGLGSASTPNIYRDWFYLSSSVARARTNFYNVNDYALSAPVWQTDQTMKPDTAFGLGGVWFGNGVWTGTPPNQVGPSYGYSGDPAVAPVKTGFFKTTYGPDANGNEVRTGTTPLSLEDVDAYNGSVTNLRDRYEIMAFASQPRSKALGGVATVAGFSPQNLGSLWPDDTTEPERQNWYRSHPWHSAQFRFTNADQANYWNQFMKKLGLPTTQ